MAKNIEIKGTNVRILTKKESDYISLTDIANYKFLTPRSPLQQVGEGMKCSAVFPLYDFAPGSLKA